MNKTIGLLLALFSICISGCSGQAAREHAANIPEHVEPQRAAATPTPSPASEKHTDAIWSGRSGNYEIVWSRDDIAAKTIDNGKQFFSVKKSAATRARYAYPEHFKNGKAMFEELTLGYRVASIVGPYLFLKETFVSTPQTSTTEKFYAVNLNEPESTVDLTKFFTEQEIVAALKQNKEIAEDLAARKLSPQTMSDLLAAYNSNAGEANGPGSGTFANCWFPKNFLQSFALKVTEGAKLQTVLGIPCVSGMRDSELRSIDLDLAGKSVPAVDLNEALRTTSGLPENGEEVFIRYKPGK